MIRPTADLKAALSLRLPCSLTLLDLFDDVDDVGHQRLAPQATQEGTSVPCTMSAISVMWSVMVCLRLLAYPGGTQILLLNNYIDSCV